MMEIEKDDVMDDGGRLPVGVEMGRDDEAAGQNYSPHATASYLRSTLLPLHASALHAASLYCPSCLYAYTSMLHDVADVTAGRC
jgi:hypothetical protein